MNSEQRYILALFFIKGLGDYRIFYLINHFGSAEAVWFQAKEKLACLPNFGIKRIEEIGQQRYLDLADQEIEFCQNCGIKITTRLDEDYPKLLNQCVDAPIVLFSKGNAILEQSKKIAIVGTRKMTPYGRQFITQLIDDLKGYDVSIISGLAYGCDIEAHKQALHHQVPTWAVLAHHLNHIYPSQHRSIAEAMLDQGGWISEQPSGNEIHPQFFLLRNRIIAGLSDVTVLVESDSRGGSLVTAKFANEYNREVFAVPGKFTDPLSKGCNHLIKTHQAYLIESSEDLLYHLNLKNKNHQKQQLELFLDLSETEQQLVEIITANGKMHIDQIAIAMELFTYELMPILLDLELKQVIRPLPGKFFELSL
ncbi:DNA-processing protein DprA [Faecalibacter sp. LW9]|uniref:DNA-processing protein DprA n=1 Tax=Faecalibacter sp. LW9 TaxID=3103144 RepID=UPI002B00033B|nr:DNA-processing protein DprA [Faecalibacter sp. LW9]